MGEERAVIRECLGTLLGVESLPTEAGAIVINAETICRIQEAVDLKKPLIDKNMTNLLVKHAHEMNFNGIYIFIDGEPEAYCIGFQNSPRMFDMFSMKSAHPHVGLNITAIIELAKELDQNITLINLEEDMGLQGLRTMKKRLNPLKLISMYNLEEAGLYEEFK